MFLGQFVCSVDANGRMELPPAFAQHLSTGAYLTQGFDHNLIVTPVENFMRMADRVSTLNKTDPLARLLSRLLLGNATVLELDARGGVTLPAALRVFSGVGEQAVLVGSGDLVEIWSPDAWEVQKNRLQDAQSNADRFTTLSLVVAN